MPPRRRPNPAPAPYCERCIKIMTTYDWDTDLWSCSKGHTLPHLYPPNVGCDACGEERPWVVTAAWSCIKCTNTKTRHQSSPSTASVVPTPEEKNRIVPSYVEELKDHFDAGSQKLVDAILQQLRPVHKNLLKSVEESWAEVAALAATVTEMRDTIKSLTAENGGLRNQLQTARKELGELTRTATTPPPPPETPTPPPRAPSKRFEHQTAPLSATISRLALRLGRSATLSTFLPPSASPR
jgi:transposase-like protein